MSKPSSPRYSAGRRVMYSPSVRDVTASTRRWNQRIGFLDLGAEGESVGDQFIFISRLLKGGEQVGHDGVVCTIVSLERQEAECVGTFWFSGGQISAQALVSFAEEPPAVPITGGSGKYEGAEGELHIRPVSETKEVLTFHLDD
ncbi:MAG: hypothetical protein M3454_12890 [Actinomycetota bacterium]|nr:hypothetical protein [Actinomycetota bacterium]